MKRAQISLFIIIGIILLITVIFTLAVVSDVLNFKPPEEQVRRDTPTELLPVQSLIEQCQQRLLEQGARQLLSTGGYLHPSSSGIISTVLPSGSGVDVSGTAIAYWHYIDGDIDRSKRPDLISENGFSVDKQLSTYVDDRLSECVQTDEIEQITVTEQSLPSSFITFSPDSTTITTKWNLLVESPVATAELSEFLSTSPIPIKKLFITGEEITTQLRDMRLPEYMTLQYLGVYTTGDSTLPPISAGYRFGRDFPVWNLHSSLDELSYIDSLAMQTLSVYGSEDEQMFVSGDNLLMAMAIDGTLVLEQDVLGTQVDISSAPTIPYLTVNDNYAFAAPSLLPSLPLLERIMPTIGDYTFLYDVTYPAIISLERNGYVLRFAYEVNIRNSQAQIGVQRVSTPDICSYPGGSDITVRTQPSNLEADITYTCGDVTCPAGRSVDGILQTTLPSCASGVLQGFAQGYFSRPQIIGSSAGVDQEETLQLYHPREVQISLVQRQVQRSAQGTYYLADNPVPVDADIYFIRQGEPFIGIVSEDYTVELVPGVYDVLVMKMEEFDPALVIPEETIEVDGDLLVINATEFNTLPTVYLDLSNDRALTLNSVPNQLTIHAPAMDVNDLQSYDDLALLTAFFEFGQNQTAQESIR